MQARARWASRESRLQVLELRRRRRRGRQPTSRGPRRRCPERWERSPPMLQCPLHEEFDEGSAGGMREMSERGCMNGGEMVGPEVRCRARRWPTTMSGCIPVNRQLMVTKQHDSYTDVGDEGIELGERDPRRGSAARRCCDVRRPSLRAPGERAPLEVICLRSMGGSATGGTNDEQTTRKRFGDDSKTYLSWPWWRETGSFFSFSGKQHL